jgi:hypothetical protein
MAHIGRPKIAVAGEHDHGILWVKYLNVYVYYGMWSDRLSKATALAEY